MSKKMTVAQEGFNLLVRLGFQIEFTATPFWIAGEGPQVQEWKAVPLTEVSGGQAIDYKALRKVLRKDPKWFDSKYYTMRVTPEEEDVAREKLRRIRLCSRKVRVHGSDLKR